jgi:hypothetical protein
MGYGGPFRGLQLFQHIPAPQTTWRRGAPRRQSKRYREKKFRSPAHSSNARRVVGGLSAGVARSRRVAGWWEGPVTEELTRPAHPRSSAADQTSSEQDTGRGAKHIGATFDATEHLASILRRTPARF